ncbi:MAG: hypothetical protein ACHQT8_06325 [Chlamydiales bacterium]
MNSVKQLFGNNQEVMVYGFSSGWKTTAAKLRSQADTVVKRVYDYDIADNRQTMLNGREFRPINATRGDTVKDCCKRTLVDWAFETWIRKDSQAQIPLLFVLDSDLNEHHANVPDMLTKKAHLNQLITHSELRRLFKLCTDERVDPEVRKAVQKNVVFAHLKSSGSVPDFEVLSFEPVELFLEQVKAPWEDPAWNVELAKRKQAQKKVKYYDWRNELNDCVRNERAQLQQKSIKPTPSLWQRFVNFFAWLFCCFK